MPSGPDYRHLFDTRAFVKRLEQNGFLSKERLREGDLTGQNIQQKNEVRDRDDQVMKWIAESREGENSKRGSAKNGKGKAKADGEELTAAASGEFGLNEGRQLSVQPLHRAHDPAEALMELTRSFIQLKGSETLSLLLQRVQVENQRYLFTAALSELSTELQVRARSDAAALRSITTLLQREVDNLSQKLKEDVENMKHE